MLRSVLCWTTYAALPLRHNIWCCRIKRKRRAINGCTCGHEFMHSQSTTDNNLGSAMLTMSGYCHFPIAHAVHHAKVRWWNRRDVEHTGTQAANPLLVQAHNLRHTVVFMASAAGTTSTAYIHLQAQQWLFPCTVAVHTNALCTPAPMRTLRQPVSNAAA